MKILIDCTQIPRRRTGVGMYAEWLIHELVSILHPRDRLYVLVQDDDTQLLELIALHANLYSLPISSSVFRSRVMLALYEQCILPWMLLYYRIDVVHSLHYTFPLLCPCSRMVTIHDLTFLIWPNMHTMGRRVIMPFFTKMALRYAEGILFVSESTRNDAERIFGPGTNQRNVTALGVDQQLFENIQPEDIEESVSRLAVRRPYILFLGTLEPRKNIIRLIQAFEMLNPKHSRHGLVIAGGLGWNYKEILDAIERSPVKEKIHRLGFVTTEDKFRLLAGCDLLVYPSLYEGFGLPVLEGMAAAVPVITSNTSSLPEVSGNATVMVDPSSVEEISAAMCRVLEDRAYSDKLRKLGKEQAGKFSWENTARLTYAAYTALKGTPRN